MIFFLEEYDPVTSAIYIVAKTANPFVASVEKQVLAMTIYPNVLFNTFPFGGYCVSFKYSMRRVNCKECGIKVELVPWSSGKHAITHHYAKYLAGWAKEMSWKTVANRFQTSWQTVYRAVEEIVHYGLEHRKIDNVAAIGVHDEPVQFQNGLL